MKKDKIQPFGDLMLELESVVLKMIDQHDLQWGEVLNLVKGYLEVHCPNAREEYIDDDSSPVFYYGPKEGLKWQKRKKQKLK